MLRKIPGASAVCLSWDYMACRNTGSASLPLLELLILPTDQNFPARYCLVDFDMKLIDLFQEMDRKQMKLRDRIRSEFYRVKELLGHTPSRLELFTYMDDDVYQSAVGNSKENPFKRYLEYRKQLDEITEDQELIYDSIGREFINLIENTNMTKVYKMPGS